MALIFVHGRGQQGRTEEDVLGEWVAALEQGVENAGLDIPPGRIGKESNLPYYGAMMTEHENASSGTINADDRMRGRGDRDRFVSDFKREVIRHQSIGEPSAEDHGAISGRPHSDAASSRASIEDAERGVLNTPWVLALARFLDRTFDAISVTLVDSILRDVGTYLTNAEVRNRINNAVAAAISESSEPRVVVAHSLGSVVAYHALHALGEQCPVEHLVTLGSPLGVRAVISRVTTPGSSMPTWPRCVRAWTNVADKRDIVALEPALDRRSLLKDGYACRDRLLEQRFDIMNITDIDNITDNRHGISGYLGDPVIAMLVLRSAKLIKVKR